MSKLRVAIVGCGGIANQKHMPSIKANEDKAVMVAFCDIIPERAEKACKEYGAEGAKVYTDYKEMLADTSIEIDVVHVCTPNVAHCPITVASFEAGKHVMCEKPMAHNTEDAQKMLDAWKKSGKKFTIGYQNRLRDDTQTLHVVLTVNAAPETAGGYLRITAWQKVPASEWNGDESLELITF